MSNKIPKKFLFLISMVVAFALYWPAMRGTPIWDDRTFWFDFGAMKPSFSYLDIWLNFSWPVSVSFQKMLFSLWGESYLYYHLLNFCLHFLNSLLVYRLGRKLQLPFHFLFFLIFLLHPCAVITTAWMIQIKTLLCMFFALVSFLCFLKGLKHTKWMILSWVCFFLSVFSKSASIFLPFIYLFITYKHYKFSKIHLLLPFFLFSLWSGQRILLSPVTTLGVQKAAKINVVKEAPPVVRINTDEETKIKDDTTTPTARPPEILKKVDDIKLKKIAPRPSSKKVSPEIHIPPTVMTETRHSLHFLKFHADMFLQTLNYYFWQTFIPLRNEPVKGFNFEHAGIVEYIHVVFLMILFFLFWKTNGFAYLISGHLLLLPFLGLLPAPYMNVTWVSDQHLYLVLPLFLAFWFTVLMKIKWKHKIFIPVFFVIFFGFKIFQEIPTYKDQVSFYEKSLQYNPYNIPIVYNLAFDYLVAGEFDKSLNLIEHTVEILNEKPIAKENTFYPHLLELYFMLKMPRGGQ